MFEDSIPCSYSEADLRAETEHFVHAHAQVHTQAHVDTDADVHWEYHIITPLLCKGTLISSLNSKVLYLQKSHTISKCILNQSATL